MALTTRTRATVGAVTSAQNRLVSVSTSGAAGLLAQKRDGLVYPTTPWWFRGNLYVVNGAIANGTPGVLSWQP